MWVLVLILVVLVLLLGLGYARLLSALRDLQEQIQKKLQSGSGVRLTSQVSKKELVALTKQVSDLCLLYTCPSPRDRSVHRMPSSA